MGEDRTLKEISDGTDVYNYEAVDHVLVTFGADSSTLKMYFNGTFTTNDDLDAEVESIDHTVDDSVAG